MSESLGKDRIEQCCGPFRFTETWHAPALVLPPHEHEHACLHFVLAGGYQETAEGRGRVFGPGTVLYKPAGVRHSNRFPECGARTLRIEIDPGFEATLGEKALQPLHSDGVGLELVARRMLGELSTPDDLTPLALEGFGRELLALFFRRPGRAKARVQLAERCAARLRECFRGRIRLGDLARELGCARSALAHAFRLRFRSSMGDYVRELRVAEVMRRIEEGDASLAEIALEAGFADQSHCTRVFHRLTGTTPALWSRNTPRRQEPPRREAGQG